MKPWIIASFASAFLFGAYNIFAKMAAGRISDTLAAFILEFSAAMLVLVYIVFGRSIKSEIAGASQAGVIYAIIGGLFIGAGSVIYFYVFRAKAPLTLAGPIIFAGATLVMFIAGIIFFREKLDFLSIAGIVLTLVGITLLSLAGNRG